MSLHFHQGFGSLLIIQTLTRLFKEMCSYLTQGFFYRHWLSYCSLTQEKVMKPLGILSLKVELEKIKGHHYQQIVNDFILICSKDVKTYHVQIHSRQQHEPLCSTGHENKSK